jgi:3-oxoadipate CoA-transferase alpha subunit
MDKVLPSLEEAIADVKDGAMIAIPGFFACGVPRALLQALIKKGTKNLTLTCGCGPMLGAAAELKQLTLNGQLKKVIDSYGLFRSASKGMADPFEQAIRAGGGKVPRRWRGHRGFLHAHRCRVGDGKHRQ